jgi:hypothetical protein
MKKPRPTIIALAGLTALLCCWSLYLSQEPHRGLVDLLSDVFPGASPSEHKTAISVLQHIDLTQQIGLLASLTADSDSKAKAALIIFLQRHGPRSMRRRFMFAEDLRINGYRSH